MKWWGYWSLETCFRCSSQTWCSGMMFNVQLELILSGSIQMVLLQMSHGLDGRTKFCQGCPSLCVLAAVSAIGLDQSLQKTGGPALNGDVTRGHTTLFSWCIKVTNEDAPTDKPLSSLRSTSSWFVYILLIHWFSFRDKGMEKEKWREYILLSFSVLCISAKNIGFREFYFCNTPENVHHNKMSLGKFCS